MRIHVAVSTCDTFTIVFWEIRRAFLVAELASPITRSFSICSVLSLSLTIRETDLLRGAIFKLVSAVSDSSPCIMDIIIIIIIRNVNYLQRITWRRSRQTTNIIKLSLVALSTCVSPSH